MRPFIRRSKWRTLFCLFFAMIAPVIVPTNRVEAAETKKQEKQETPQYTISGRDPKAFADAAALFAHPGQKFLDDQTAKSILAGLEMSFQRTDPWSPQLWVQLDRLRAVKMSPQMVEALRDTAEKTAVADRPPAFTRAIVSGFAFVAIIVGGIIFGCSKGGPKRRMAGIILAVGIAVFVVNFTTSLYALRKTTVQVAAAKQPFEQGNSHYEAGRFDQAVESYRVALTDYPAFWDAWNNMALAEMHSNNDLVALFVFSTLTKNNPKYAGGSINLSVCLERLGQDSAAYDIAAAVVAKQDQMPMARYNMAWFENSRAKFGSASTYLVNSMGSVSDYAVAKWLQTINSMESGRSITAVELKALPGGFPSQSIPKIVSKPVMLATADAYTGKARVAKIPRGSQLVISAKAGDWYAVYWPVGNVKRRLWIHQACLGRQTLVAQ